MYFHANEFRKASASQPDGNCVEIVRRGDVVEIRDSKTTFGAPDDHRIRLDAAEFDDFVDAWLQGRPHPAIELVSDGNEFRLRRVDDIDVELVYTAGEIAAFTDGARKREFAEDALPVASAA